MNTSRSTSRPFRIVLVGARSTMVGRLIASIARELGGDGVEVRGAPDGRRADLLLVLGCPGGEPLPAAVERVRWDIPEPEGRGELAMPALDAMLRFRLAVLLGEACIGAPTALAA